MTLAKLFSLSIMQALPIKYVKIEARLSKESPSDATDIAITKGAISMVNELGPEACAEYV